MARTRTQNTQMQLNKFPHGKNLILHVTRAGISLLMYCVKYALENAHWNEKMSSVLHLLQVITTDVLIGGLLLGQSTPTASGSIKS